MRSITVGIVSGAALLLGMVGCSGGGQTSKGDAKRGEELYAQCAACHSPTQNMVGPKHCGVVGRAAGSVPEFSYSAAMKDSGLTWDEKTLSEFLASPFTYVNGTAMGFAGLHEASERDDMIAYLKTMTPGSALCP